MTPSNLEIQVEEQRGSQQSIPHLSTARTAFVGRTLRGPVNQPVFIKSFGEFTHMFGGLWQPSLLGYAVEQFFDNGGREALIVRVVNGARSATLTLSAGAAAALTLQALRPGTREFLRASIDYDNIPEGHTALFNLTVQRVRAQGTGQVEDQEIFHRLSVSPDSDAYLPKIIGQSKLVRLLGAIPLQRPQRTVDASSGLATAYVHSNSDGDDGAPLSDYDLVGSQERRTGLFALLRTEYFNFLCLPPLSREQDVGPSALLVAARFCKERRALLIVDPPSGWHTAEDALGGLRDWDFCNENALMFFPHVLAHDKLRGHFESFAPCGAVAGMLARNDEISPLWDADRSEEAVLRPGYRPTCMVSEEKRKRLAAAGVNTIQGVRSAARLGPRPRTLAAGHAGNADWQYLTGRRLALFIVNCIERATRWTVPASSQPPACDRVAAQVRVFFEALCRAGAFRARRVADAFFVVCDERADPRPAPETFQFVFGFAAAREHEFHVFRITHAPAGSNVRQVSVNRLNFAEYCPAELEWVDSIASQLEP